MSEENNRLKVSDGPTKQSVKPGTVPAARDMHAEREQHRAKMDTKIVSRQYKTAIPATHGTNVTYANKPLSTGPKPEPRVSEKVIDYIKSKAQEKIIKK